MAVKGWKFFLNTTLPDATPPIGEIHPFQKIAVTFEPVMQYGCPPIFEKKVIF